MPLVRFKRKDIIEPASLHVRAMDGKSLRLTPIYPFYRKMRIHNWEPVEYLLETLRINGKLQARLVYRFKHDRTKRVLNMHISRQEMLYFTVVKGSKVYQSKFCLNYNEFDKEFCRYFKRRRPVLDQKPGY